MHFIKTFAYIEALVSCSGVMQCFHTDVSDISTTDALHFDGLIRLQNNNNNNNKKILLSLIILRPGKIPSRPGQLETVFGTCNYRQSLNCIDQSL